MDWGFILERTVSTMFGVEVLVFALAAVGRSDTGVRLRLNGTAEEAQELGFVGSPTVLVDGTDPFATTDSAAGLSCRLYRAGATMSGSAGVEQLIAALAARLGAV